MDITVQVFYGAAATPYLEDLARLRIEVFKDFPYLYEGDMAYEKTYLETFFQAANSILVLAFADGKIVGASTGLPMSDETLDIQAPWIEKGYDLSTIFYFGESVLLPAYRGQGIGVQFFKHREDWARQLHFQTTVFCSVIRPENHPLRPADYRPLDEFWNKRGYQPAEEVICKLSWKDVQEAIATEKSLQCWKRVLSTT